MSSDEETYVLVPSPSSDIISLPTMSIVSSRTPTPPLLPSHLTIHDLGDRLLTRIFLVLASIHRPFVEYREHHEFGFVLASHVCRGWRAIMLACPELWTRDVFTFPNEHAMLTILERAQDLPLEVNLTFDYQRTAARSSSLCFNLLPRIRTLRLRPMDYGISRVGFHDLLISMIAQGSPILESLEVNQGGLRAEDRTLNLEFFAPNLRFLRLNGIFFPCLSATLSTIQLKLARAYSESDDVFDALRGSPDTLEHVLFDVVPDRHLAHPGHYVSAFRQDIYLPSAKLVAFRGYDTELLKSLQVPPDTFFCISLSAPLGRVADAMDDISWTRVRAVLSLGWPCTLSLDAAQEPVRLSLLSLPLDDQARHDQALAVATHSLELAHGLYECMSYGSDLPDQTIHPGLVVEWHGQFASAAEEQSGGEKLHTLLELVRYATENSEDDLFQPIRCLDICIPEDLLPAEWVYLLKGYGAVETLRMHIASIELLQALTTQTRTVLPNLTALAVVLDNVPVDNTTDVHEYQRIRGLMKTLERLVVERLEAGRDSGIELVRLEGKSDSMCFAETVRERLSIYVPQVEVVLY
ncbi:hypothetical protein PENSPDRAFT_691233 [Peniophora sp. CONT]|nr:hypothetical protein PENSPDRAFT_691233 [Peniophora sp. CONT]